MLEIARRGGGGERKREREKIYRGQGREKSSEEIGEGRWLEGTAERIGGKEETVVKRKETEVR